MKTPTPNTIELSERKLWITDAELIRRMGVPEKIARETLRMLDTKAASGFPRKVKLWGDRRYWPDVKAYFDAQYGTNMNRPQRRTGS